MKRSQGWLGRPGRSQDTRREVVVEVVDADARVVNERMFGEEDAAFAERIIREHGGEP